MNDIKTVICVYFYSFSTLTFLHKISFTRDTSLVNKLIYSFFLNSLSDIRTSFSKAEKGLQMSFAIIDRMSN